MQWFCVVLPFLLLTACGTAVKVYDSGPIDQIRFNSRGEPLAPVVLIYNFKIKNDRHEIFFWDEFKNRFNLKVDGKIDTRQGIVFYLPADRSYALSGFLHVQPSFSREFGFGTDLPMFWVRPGVVTQIAYFEIGDMAADGHFKLLRTKTAAENQIYQTTIAKKFGYAGKIVTTSAIE